MAAGVAGLFIWPLWFGRISGAASTETTGCSAAISWLLGAHSRTAGVGSRRRPIPAAIRVARPGRDAWSRGPAFYPGGRRNSAPGRTNQHGLAPASPAAHCATGWTRRAVPGDDLQPLLSAEHLRRCAMTGRATSGAERCGLRTRSTLPRSGSILARKKAGAPAIAAKFPIRGHKAVMLYVDAA